MSEFDPRDLLADLIARARRAGADAADALLVDSQSLSVAERLGQPEKLDRAETRDLGLRVFVGRRVATVSTTDFSPALRAELVERGLAMARLAPEDPYAGIAEAAQCAQDWPDLDLNDPFAPGPEDLRARVRRAEEAALAVPGVTNSEGAEASWGRAQVTLATSNGFAGTKGSTSHALSVSVIAGAGTGMERAYDWQVATHAADLRDPAQAGRTAGEKAVRRLNPRKMATQSVPVIFDPQMAGGLLRTFAGAISGAAIARGTSFLKDSLGQAVFRPGIRIIDDPFRVRGLRSRPFDGEGLAGGRRALIDDGHLTGWQLDLAAARQLGLAPTGNGSRGTGGPPGPAPSNLWLEPGSASPAELMADIKAGLYVTELLGFGINMVTGDYSRGAAGYWIENGELAFPVSEVTIAGNLRDMFKTLTPASDLEFRFGIDAPTLRIDGMTLAGK